MNKGFLELTRGEGVLGRGWLWVGGWGQSPPPTADNFRLVCALIRRVWTIATGIHRAHTLCACPLCGRRLFILIAAFEVAAGTTPMVPRYSPDQSSERLNWEAQGSIPSSREWPLRPRQATWHMQGHQASRMKSKNSNSGPAQPKPAVFTQEALRPQRAASELGSSHLPHVTCLSLSPHRLSSRALMTSPIRSEGTNVDESSYFTRKDRLLSPRKKEFNLRATCPCAKMTSGQLATQ